MRLFILAILLAGCQSVPEKTHCEVMCEAKGFTGGATETRNACFCKRAK